MTTHTTIRRFQIAVGHRVMGHEGKCRFLHGHNYVILVFAKAVRLDSLGRVIDFGVLKGTIGSWLESQWDHGFVLKADDREAIESVRPLNAPAHLYLMRDNPTAENMAQHLVEDVCPELLRGTGVEVVGCRIMETENCWADYFRPQGERA